jgi:hypothetical protein
MTARTKYNSLCGNITCSCNHILSTNFYAEWKNSIAGKEKISNYVRLTVHTALTVADRSLEKTLDSTACQVLLSGGINTNYDRFAKLSLLKSRSMYLNLAYVY